MYVANWVAEISEYSEAGDWKHNDGKMNPADMCTRGFMDPANLLQQDEHGKPWLLGPDILPEEQQADNIVIDKMDEDNTEIEKKIYW